MPLSWQLCGAVHPRELSAARLEMHWALQPVATIGNSLAPAKPDYSHTAVQWSGALQALIGQPLKSGARFGLRPATMEILCVPESRVELAYAMHGKTLNQAQLWVRSRLEELGETDALTPPDYGAEGMPDAPAGHDAVYELSNLQAHQELAHWFSDANLLLQSFAQETGASPVVCWPHHFDIATLITFDPNEPDAEKARSAGLGMSAGDSFCDEPYFYIGPWPRSPGNTMPAPGGDGQWHESGLGMLPASRVVVNTSAESQEAQVKSFFQSSLAIAKRSLGVT